MADTDKAPPEEPHSDEPRPIEEPRPDEPGVGESAPGVETPAVPLETPAEDEDEESAPAAEPDKLAKPDEVDDSGDGDGGGMPPNPGTI